MTNTDLMAEFTKVFKLPHWPAINWMRYISSYVEQIKDDDVGLLFHHQYPGLMEATAKLKMEGLPTENIAGILHGINLCMWLHYQGYLKFEPPPLREEMHIV